MKYYAGLILGILFSGLNYQDNSQTEKGIMVKQNEKGITDLTAIVFLY